MGLIRGRSRWVGRAVESLFNFDAVALHFLKSLLFGRLGQGAAALEEHGRREAGLHAIQRGKLHRVIGRQTDNMRFLDPLNPFLKGNKR